MVGHGRVNNGGMGLTEWQTLPAARRLRVPLGSTVDGQPIEVDLKPPPLGGIGAHGLITGIAAGARLDLLNTLLCGLISTHSPETVQLCLLDGAAEELFLPYHPAPHTINSALPGGPNSLIEALVALTVSRGRLLTEHGMRTQHDYDRARHYQPDLPPMTPLVVVVHRLSLLHRRLPELTEALRRYCAVWRDRGIHLLVVEDRLVDLPAELDGYFGFELAVSDRGAELRVPGQPPVPFALAPPPEPKALVASLPSRPQSWLGPTRGLDLVALAPLEQTEERGLHSALWSVCPAVGLRLGTHRGDTFHLVYDRGQVLLVGGRPGALDQALATFALAMALHRTPRELRLYLLDLNGGGLGWLAGLPHARVAVNGADDSLRERTTRELNQLIQQRELRNHRNRSGHQPAHLDEPGEIVVIVRGWPDPELHPGLAPVLKRLVLRGEAVGVHVILGLSRWGDLDPDLRGAFRYRLELQLDDPATSPLSGPPPTGWSSFGRTADGEHFQLASPSYGNRDLVKEVAAAWTHPVDRLTALPYQVTYAELRGSDRDLKLGMVEGSGSTLTFTGKRNLLVLGDDGSGRSTAIRTFLRGLVALRKPEEARVVGVDFGRAWFNAHCEGSLLEYVRSSQQFDKIIGEAQKALHPRIGSAGWTGPDLYLVIDDYHLLSASQRSLIGPMLETAEQTGFHLVIAGRHPGGADEVTRRLTTKDTMVLTLSGAEGQRSPVSGVPARPLPPGRARTRWLGQEQTVQLTWTT